jgi:hypothetical protein
METQELHLIATVGDQDPERGSNAERVQKAAENIVKLLEPAGLWVLCGPKKETYQTAGQLNDQLGDLSLNPGNVAENGFLAPGAVKAEGGAEEWLSDLSVRSYLTFLKSKHLSQRHKTGLVLVTSEDIVKQIPDILDKSGYQQDTDTSYGGVNYLKVEVDDSGMIPEKRK